MARNIASDDDGFLYRAVVNDGQWTYHYGPYTNAGTAKSQLTREVNWGKRRGRETTGKIQRTRFEWEDMP